MKTVKSKLRRRDGSTAEVVAQIVPASREDVAKRFEESLKKPPTDAPAKAGK